MDKSKYELRAPPIVSDGNRVLTNRNYGLVFRHSCVNIDVLFISDDDYCKVFGVNRISFRAVIMADGNE